MLVGWPYHLWYHLAIESLDTALKQSADTPFPSSRSRLDLSLCREATSRSHGHRGDREGEATGAARPFVERVIGCIRRECLDHIVPLGEGHLRRVLRECVEYYNESRCHMALDGDAPKTREREHGDGPIVAKPILGGLHHRYSRAGSSLRCELIASGPRSRVVVSTQRDQLEANMPVTLVRYRQLFWSDRHRD